MRAGLVYLSLGLAATAVLAEDIDCHAKCRAEIQTTGSDSYHNCMADCLQERDLSNVATDPSALDDHDLANTAPSTTIGTAQPSDMDILTFPTTNNGPHRRANLLKATDVILLSLARDVDSAEPPDVQQRAPATQASQQTELEESSSVIQDTQATQATEATQLRERTPATDAAESDDGELVECAEAQCTHTPPQDYKPSADDAYKKTTDDGDYWIMSGEEGNKDAVDSGASTTSATFFALGLTLAMAGFLV